MFRRCQVSRIQMVKSFAMEEVISELSSPQDLMFFRMSGGKKRSFFAWPGLGHQDAAAAMLGMPPQMMTCHSCFGRQGTPVHLCIDIDRKLPEDQQGDVELSKMMFKNLVEDVVPRVDKFITETKKEKIAKQCVLRSPNLKKNSFHLHVELEGGRAFESAQALGEWMSPLKDTCPTIDFQIYRNMGMLRMYSQKKDDGTSKLELYEGIPELNIGLNHNDKEAKEIELMKMSFIVAENPKSLIGAHADLKGARPGIANTSPQFGGAKNMTGVRSAVVPIPRNASMETAELAEKLTMELPPAYYTEYKDWIVVGLMLKKIAFCCDGNSASGPANQKLLKAWDTFSKKGAASYEVGGCEKRWNKFQGDGRQDISWRTSMGWLAKRSDFNRQ